MADIGIYGIVLPHRFKIRQEMANFYVIGLIAISRPILMYDTVLESVSQDATTSFDLFLASAAFSTVRLKL